MTTLSFKPAATKAFVGAAASIYVIIETASSLAFEVLASDAAILRTLVGTYQTFYHHDVFSGRLEELAEAEPIHPALKILKRPVLHARIRKFAGPTSMN